MPLKFKPEKIQEWVTKVQAGDRIEAVAKAENRDPRVIRKHVEAALRQRDIAVAQSRLLEEALRKHQADLMTVITEISNVLTRSAVSHPVEPVKAGEVLTCGSTKVHMGEDGFERLQYKVKDQRTWDLIHQHLPGDRLWKALATWEKAILAELNGDRISASVGSGVTKKELDQLETETSEAASSVLKIVNDIQLLHFFPGRCEICRRLER